MNQIKYQRLRNDCQAAIADDNFEKCFELLAESLDERAPAYNDYLNLRAQFNSALRHWSTGQISADEYFRSRSQIRSGLIGFVNNSMKPEDVSLLRRIHDRILIVACKNSPNKWEEMFSEAFFSHFRIIQYGDAMPDDFNKPDIVVFDDLNCATKNAVFMHRYIRENPRAHFLYVGKDNPLEDDDPAAFGRSANANSRITVYARLRELLEYRKYLSPDANEAGQS